MHRTDRLFDLIQILRDGRLHRAADLAARLEVSVRTIWRDMATLQHSGLPVEGERGVGYMLRAPITLPPVALTEDELEALRLGVMLVARAADPGLARAADSLTAKIAAVTPGWTERPGPDTFVFSSPEAAAAAPHLPVLRRGIRERLVLVMRYVGLSREDTLRRVRPLQIEFWGRVWTLTAWCELREDFRVFRVDRIMDVAPSGERFEPEPGREVEDYLARLAPE
ncbi:MAG: YafY family transcriptional regulator [Rhodobacteraceae bacterium]|nr:YafY family transcriptional regulator [Paracoccaceae bacterium]